MRFKSTFGWLFSSPPLQDSSLPRTRMELAAPPRWRAPAGRSSTRGKKLPAFPSPQTLLRDSARRNYELQRDLGQRSAVPSRCSSGVPERCCSQQRCAELRAELHLRGCAAERLQLRTSIFACSPFRRFEKGRVFCHGRVCENQTTARGRLICLHSVRPLLLRPNGKERIIFVSGFSLFARV